MSTEHPDINLDGLFDEKNGVEYVGTAYYDEAYTSYVCLAKMHGALVRVACRITMPMCGGLQAVEPLLHALWLGACTCGRQMEGVGPQPEKLVCARCTQIEALEKRVARLERNDADLSSRVQQLEVFAHQQRRGLR